MATLKPRLLEPFENPDNVDLHMLWGLTDECIPRTGKKTAVEQKDCLIKAKNDYLQKCRDKNIEEKECDRLINNGQYAFCKYVQDFDPCKSRLYYQPRPLPTPAPPPPPPPPTRPPPTTTAAPFPIIPTVGGFAGGVILMAIVLITSFFIWKKKAKKTGSASTSSNSPLLQKHPNDSVYLGRGNYS